MWFDQLAPPDVATNFRPQRFAGGHEVLTWWQGTVTHPGLRRRGRRDRRRRLPNAAHRAARATATPTDLHEFVITHSGDALFTVTRRCWCTCPGRPPVRARHCWTRSSRRWTSAPAWSSGSGMHSVTFPSRTPTPRQPIALTTTRFTSIRCSRCAVTGCCLVSDTSAVYMVNRATGADPVDARRQGQQLPPGPRGPVLPSTTRRCHVQSHRPVRRRGRPPSRHRPRGADPLARSAAPHRDGGARLPPQHARPAGRQRGQSAATARPATCSSALGPTPFFSEFALVTVVSPLTPACPRVTGATASSCSRGPRHPRPGRRSPCAGAPPTRVSVYASWNGATTVARWQVLAGPSATSLAPRTSAAKRGFETKLTLSSTATTFAVRALSASGRVLATSKPILAR